MKRTPLFLRALPDYTRGEELFNFISHIAGGGFSVLALISATLVAILYSDIYGIISAIIYGSSMVTLYSMSSIYHGLRRNMAKKVFQVLDHCTIYFLIAGSYTPILLNPIRRYSPLLGFGMLAAVWLVSGIGCVFTAIDLKKYGVFSMACYILLGWCILLIFPIAISSMPPSALTWLLSGGISYTIGALLFGLGKRIRYMHSIFHIFVVLGSLLQYISIMIVLPL